MGDQNVCNIPAKTISKNSITPNQAIFGQIVIDLKISNFGKTYTFCVLEYNQCIV